MRLNIQFFLRLLCALIAVANLANTDAHKHVRATVEAVEWVKKKWNAASYAGGPKMYKRPPPTWGRFRGETAHPCGLRTLCS